MCELPKTFEGSYFYGLHLLRASVFNYGRLDILWDSIEHLSKIYCLLNFQRAFVFNFVRLDILCA